MLAAVLTSTAYAQEPNRVAKTKPCAHPQVLIAGGENLQPGDTALASAELYDLAAKTFSSTGNMVLARFGHTATTLADGRILLAGGYSSGFALTATAEIYDPATGMFSPTGSMNVARVSHTATLLRDGTVLITGGISNDDTDVASAEIYHPTSGSFTLTGPMMIARETHSATLLNTGAVLITGGYNNESLTLLQSAELYRPWTHRFFKVRGNLVAPGSQSAILLSNGRVLLVGGSDPLACCPHGANKGAEIYHPWFGTFRKTRGDMQEIRSSPTLTLLHDGEVLVAGGYPYEGELNDAEPYDPIAQTFTLTNNLMSSARGGAYRHVVAGRFGSSGRGISPRQTSG